ncbi:MAG: UDP-N-acetylmuramoyl-tripeptide--D-alanyl-D-alanine ligase [Lachnospiraceae bacterium]|nr:UDP-N-acetylmuramoyl-tripeptide--D-alanyl-D-alanine ligase [Lachnospiraceae bacterium]
MKNMTPQKMAEAVKGELFTMGKNAGREVEKVVIDSRLAEENCLFIAMKGERVDSHKFIPEVFDKGARCVISERPLTPEEAKGPYILVPSALKALEDLALFYRSGLSTKVVSITGSVGKTSTKEAIATVLSERFCVLKTEKNLNNNIGLPLTLLQIQKEHEIAVVEMGISHFGEMEPMSLAAAPDIALITNIGDAHVENLKSREGILEEKSHIFDALKPGGFALLNGNDPLLSVFRPQIKDDARVLYFGLDKKAAGSLPPGLYASDIVSSGLEGSSFTLSLSGQADLALQEGLLPLSASCPLPGEHSVTNAVCAALVGILCGMTAEELRSGIGGISTISGRSNIVRTERLTILDDCYNANPDSMRAALKMLERAEGRKVAVLGDMFELGENEAALHREVGAFAAGTKPDILIGIGDLAKELCAGAAEKAALQGGIPEIRHYSSPEEFKRSAPSLLKEGDTCLVKASHGMNFAELVEYLKTF